MTPKALIMLILTLLGLAGGGSTYVTNFLHSNTPSDAVTVHLQDQAIQIALLQQDVNNIKNAMSDLKESDNRILRILLRDPEGLKKGDRK